MTMKNHSTLRLADCHSSLDDAPSSFEARGGDNAAGAGAVVKIDDAIANLTMTGGCDSLPSENSTSPSSKENVRPNSGKKKSWKKKNHRPALAATSQTSIPAESQVPSNSIGRPILLKNKKAVVVEISPQDTIPIVAPRPILPGMDYNVTADAEGSSPFSIKEEDAIAAIDAAAGEDEGRRNRSRSSRSQRKSKKNQQRSKKSLTNQSPANDMNTGLAAAGEDDFSTNAEGASVLALLGQYSYATTTSNDGSYDGFHYPNSFGTHSTMVMTGGDSYQQHHMQYNPSNYSSMDSTPSTSCDGQHVAYSAYCPYDATSSAVPLGYCVPVTINGAVYYHQFGSAENAPYYYYGYPTYETSTDQHYYYSAHHPQNNEYVGDMREPAYHRNESAYEEA